MLSLSGSNNSQSKKTITHKLKLSALKSNRQKEDNLRKREYMSLKKKFR
jgi:hypothetical protein